MPASEINDLRRIFARGGYVRSADLDKRAIRGSSAYKKGYEVRFVLENATELKAVRRLLRAAGFRPAKPFTKHSKIVQPVYGRAAVDTIRGDQ